jgi:2-polyprenyl-3-methyl-5-hydroxy-6-metoxy-1,4-benzoquinol methylase
MRLRRDGREGEPVRFPQKGLNATMLMVAIQIAYRGIRHLRCKVAGSICRAALRCWTRLARGAVPRPIGSSHADAKALDFGPPTDPQARTGHALDQHGVFTLVVRKEMGKVMAFTQIPVHPTLEEQAAFFDEWNSNRTQCFEAIAPESKARGERVLQVLRGLGLERPTVLEVGCGTGWLTEKLIEIGPTTGIDLSQKAIAIAKSRGFKAEFIAGDFATQIWSPGSFDIGVSVEVISTIPDQQLFVERLASLIRPGGYVVVTAQNKFVYQRRSDVQAVKCGQIRRWLSRKEFHRLLRPRFQILKSVTVLPKGDRGIMRLVNSWRVNWLLSRIISEAAITRAKEAVGLGHCRIVLAQRRAR